MLLKVMGFSTLIVLWFICIESSIVCTVIRQGSSQSLADSSGYNASYGDHRSSVNSLVVGELKGSFIQVTNQICPKQCKCSYDGDGTIDIVDCSKTGLREIPDLPSSSREVLLQDNSIQNVSCAKLNHLKNLTKLNLSGNKGLLLHACSFFNLSLLQHLFLTSCRLPSLSRGVFDSLSNLLSLDLSENYLENFDPVLFSNMRNLAQLDLSTNKVSKIRNNTFNHLSSLMSLSLQNNLLHYEPGVFEEEAFQGLFSLTTLHLEGNQPYLTQHFTYPDRALSFLTTLKMLWLDGYPRPLGPKFSALENLKYLKFTGYCKMQSDIPSDFFTNINTKLPLTLDMSSCSISVLPSKLFAPLPTIYSLDLSKNQELLIDGFEKGSVGLANSSLTILRLNSITNDCTVGSYYIKNTTFKHLSNTTLKVLIVEHNRIANVNPQAIVDLPRSMEEISFQNNEIDMPYYFYTMLLLQNLKVMKLSVQHREPFLNRKGLTLCTKSQKLYLLTNNESNVPSQPTSTIFEDPDRNEGSLKNERASLNGLVKQFYQLSSTHKNLMPFPKNVEYVYMGEMRVFFRYHILRSTIFNNQVIKYIDMSRNNLLYLSGPVYGLPRVQHLDISRNSIFRVDESFFSELSSLLKLYLNQNKLGTCLGDDTKGFSEVTCKHLLTIKRNSPNFTVHLHGNHKFECSCDNLYFLSFLLDHPGIFEDVSEFQCRVANAAVGYPRLPEFLPQLSLRCAAQDIFVDVLVMFFVVSGGVAICALYHYKRWQWKYLYYVGRRRLHIGSIWIHHRQAAHAFITYDQENRTLRNLMKNLIRPRLHQMGISFVFGETDFVGAPQGLASSIAGAVTSTGKTVVFLTKDIFKDYYRQTEVNLAIMHEFYLRRPVLLPVLLFSPETLPVRRWKQTENSQPCSSDPVTGNNGECQNQSNMARKKPTRKSYQPRAYRRDTSQVEDVRQFDDLLRHFQPEIAAFLQGEMHRCLVYSEGSDHFWEQLRDAILEGGA